MGDAINMAARLMCHPEASENMLCDEKSYNLCINDFEFKALGETKVKGKAHPISIFRPVSELDDASRKKDDDNSTKTPIIGRISERTTIKSVLAKMVNKDQSGIVILEADGGQGLSTLYEYVRQEGAVRGCVFG
jgi:hypothetical protein